VKTFLSLVKKTIAAPFVITKYHFRLWLHMNVLSRVEYKNRLTVGRGVIWNYGCYLNALGGISIGDNVLIGPHSIIVSTKHIAKDTSVPISAQGNALEKVIIESDCWIGANVTILAGVHIGRGCIIGAGAVVTHDIPPYSVAVGVPAKVIKARLRRETE
jgi:acetyltransferase-like isoleucine patch superfamily enzyme